MPEIKLYVSPICPYCVTLKAFLKEKGFDFEEIDVSKDEKTRDELIEKSGQMQAPIIEINGQIIAGFDREKITKLLGIQD